MASDKTAEPRGIDTDALGNVYAMMWKKEGGGRMVKLDKDTGALLAHADIGLGYLPGVSGVDLSRMDIGGLAVDKESGRAFISLTLPGDGSNPDWVNRLGVIEVDPADFSFVSLFLYEPPDHGDANVSYKRIWLRVQEDAGGAHLCVFYTREDLNLAAEEQNRFGFYPRTMPVPFSGSGQHGAAERFDFTGYKDAPTP